MSSLQDSVVPQVGGMLPVEGGFMVVSICNDLVEVP